MNKKYEIVMFLDVINEYAGFILLYLNNHDSNLDLKEVEICSLFVGEIIRLIKKHF